MPDSIICIQRYDGVDRTSLFMLPGSFLSGVVVGDPLKNVGVPSRETGRSVGDTSFGEAAKNEDLRSARVSLLKD